jgi:flagellar biogenesis protein FliO
MKLHLLIKILFVLLVSAFLVQVCIAQEPTAEEQTQTQAETTEDSDHLPFMQKEQTAEYEEPGTGSLLIKTFGALLLIVGLIFAGAWTLKKLGYGGIISNNSEDTPELAILSKVSTGNGQTLSIVKFGERTLLIGSTAQSFTMLAEQNEDELKAEPRSVADMLAEENLSFEEQFEKAQDNLAILPKNGGQI